MWSCLPFRFKEMDTFDQGLSWVWRSPWGPLNLLFPPMMPCPQQQRIGAAQPQNVGRRQLVINILFLVSPKHSSLSQEMQLPAITPWSWYLAWSWQRALPQPEYVIGPLQGAQNLTWPLQVVTALWVHPGNSHDLPWIVWTSYFLILLQQRPGWQMQGHWLSSSWNCGACHWGAFYPEVVVVWTTTGAGAIIFEIFII